MRSKDDEKHSKFNTSNSMKNSMILIIDDIKFTRESIANVLLSFGFFEKNIIKCDSGHQAIDLLNQYDFDFILADLMMDNGDGFDIIQYLAHTRYKTSLIIMSSLEREIIDISYQIASDKKNTFNMLGAFSKPLKKELLRTLIVDNYAKESKTTLLSKERTLNLSEILSKKSSFNVNSSPFCMFYQPKICSETGKTTSYEALARLYLPEHGILYPDLFLPLLNEKGLMEKFTDLTIELCIADMKKIQTLFDFDFKVSINIAVDVFGLSDFPHRFLTRTTGVSPENLTIEITEEMESNNKSFFMINAARVRMMGFGLSLDDFGAEHSNINRLSNIPFTEVKIDKQYVFSLLDNPKKLILVKMMIKMAKMLSLKVVVEGIESQEIAKKISEFDVDELQGYYFSKPISFNSVVKQLNKDFIFQGNDYVTN